jgi:hypothetical protein
VFYDHRSDSIVPIIVEVLNNVAALLIRRDTFDKADFLARLLKNETGFLGLDYLAQVLREHGKLQKAEGLFRHLLEIRESNLAPTMTLLAPFLTLLSFSWSKTSSKKESLCIVSSNVLKTFLVKSTWVSCR